MSQTPKWYKYVLPKDENKTFDINGIDAIYVLRSHDKLPDYLTNYLTNCAMNNDMIKQSFMNKANIKRKFLIRINRLYHLHEP